MNTGTLVTMLVIAAVLAVLIALAIRQMMRGWLRRAQRQAQMIGTLPKGSWRLPFVTTSAVGRISEA